MLYKTKEFKEICGMSQTTLSVWVSNGVVTPSVKGADGRGHSHRFTLMQAVAVSYGRAYQEAGCPMPIVAGVVDFVSNLSQDEMEKHFDQGESVLYPIPGNPVWFDPSNDPNPTRNTRVLYANLNLEAVYNRVKKRAKLLSTTNGKANRT